MKRRVSVLGDGRKVSTTIAAGVIFGRKAVGGEWQGQTDGIAPVQNGRRRELNSSMISGMCSCSIVAEWKEKSSK